MNLTDNRRRLMNRIRISAEANGRAADSVALIAVSKTFPAESVRTLYRDGQRAFGENYIQEWQQKRTALADCPEIEWHIIGHVQSNKSRAVAEHAHWLHTLDRIRLAERLNAQRPAALPPLQVCIEINISGETAKHGIPPAAMMPLAVQIAALPRLCLRGLMCVAQAEADDAALHRQFQTMQNLLAQLQTAVPQADTLSMGMSGDWEQAVACGATMIRIGSTLFGRRS